MLDCGESKQVFKWGFSSLEKINIKTLVEIEFCNFVVQNDSFSLFC